MKTLVGIIGTLIVTMIGVYYAYHLNSEKADVRYTLSEPIPTRLLTEKTGESIQQLEVKNIGNTEAKDIRVFINANIAYYDLLKYSKAHSTKEFKGKDSLEVLYPSLPPNGNFKLLIKSVGGIKNWNLTISHSKGNAEEVFAKSSFRSIIAILSILLWAGILIVQLIMFSLGSTKDSLERRARWSPDEILRKKKPFYITDKAKWFSIRKDAIENFIEKSSPPIQKSDAYAVLSISKPDYLSDEEWISITKKAIEWLSKRISSESSGAWKASRIIELLNIPKPLQFPEKEWQVIVKDLNEKYFETIKKDQFLLTIDRALQTLKQKKPDNILDDYWTDYMKYVRTDYFTRLSHAIEVSSTPMQFIGKNDLEVLTENERSELTKHAYAAEIKYYFKFDSVGDAEEMLKTKKPKWMTDEDYQLLLSQAKTAVEVKVSQKKNDILRNSLHSILNGHTLTTKKPDELTEKEWNEIEQIDKDVRILSAENKTMEKEIAREKYETTALKEKVLRQLRIIDELFKEPKSIYTIEEYDNVFAPGNYANLKKLAESLAAQKS